MAPLSPYHRPGCARLGSMRLNAARLNVYEHWAAGVIDGDPNPGGGAPGTGLRIDGAQIQHVLNEQTDTAAFRTRGFTPIAGQRIAVYDGDTDATHQLFGGLILETTQLYESRKENAAHDIRCIDPTWLMLRQVVLTTYTNTSATAIVIDLIARFSRGFTVANVAAGLPVIDQITFTNESLPTCLTAVCQRIGAYWYVDYNYDVHVFLSETTNANPITDTNPHTARDFALTEDLSQVATKIIGRGGGGSAAVDVAAGATELPITDDGWYQSAGGIVEVSGSMRVTYTGVAGRGGVGALVGTGNAPTNAPAVIQASTGPPGGSSGMLVGATYQYAVSFVNESGTPPTLGETLVGPVRSGTPSGAYGPAPTLFLLGDSSFTASGSNNPVIGGVYYFKIAFRWRVFGDALSTVFGPVTYNGKLWQFYTGLTAKTADGVYYWPDLAAGTPPGEYGQVLLYRTTAGAGPGGPFYGMAFFDVPQNVGGSQYQLITYPFNDADIVAGAGGGPPSPANPFNCLYLKNIPVSGLSSVKQRKIYRTAANGSQLKLLTTITNNTDTAYIDTAADGALGANAPTSDASGITDNRQVAIGATSLPVSDMAVFNTDTGGTGIGWVRVGNMPIRFTGISGGNLTGVPAAGVGAITAAIRYGAQVLAQPRLIGIPITPLPGSLTVAVQRGDPVVIRFEQQDATAINAMYLRLKPYGTPGNFADGIIEYVISDSRWDLVELVAQVAATLTERKDPRVVLTFESRDLSLQVGRVITVNTTQPPINGTYRIQRITFSEIAISGLRGSAAPLRHVEATNKLFTFADLLRQMRGRETGVG